MSHNRQATRLTRRQFGGIVSATATVPMLRASQTAQQPRRQQPDYVMPPRPVVADAPPFAGKLEFTPKQVAPTVAPFPMSQVRLLPNNVLHDAQEWNRATWRDWPPTGCSTHFVLMPGCRWERPSFWADGSSPKRPLVLAGDLGNEGLTDGHTSGPNFRVGAANVEQHGSPLAPINRTPPIADIEIPTFRAVDADPSSWIRPPDSRGYLARQGRSTM